MVYNNIFKYDLKLNLNDRINEKWIFHIFNKFFLTSRGSLPPDISSEISKFPPAGRISSEHGSRVRSFIPLGLSYTRLNGAYNTKIDLSYTRLNGAFAIID